MGRGGGVAVNYALGGWEGGMQVDCGLPLTPLMPDPPLLT